MNLKLLETFILLAEFGNFNRVADRLYTTQPAISARLRSLEKELGFELVDRSSKGFKLTPKGHEVLGYARVLIDTMHEMRVRISDTKTLTGSIRIGVIGTIIHSWLPNLVRRLRTDYPQVVFELHSATSLEISEELSKGAIDVALFMGPLEDLEITNLDLGSFPMAWVANPRCYRFEKTVDVADLAAMPILSYPRGSEPYRMIEGYFREARPRRLLLNCSDSLASIIRLTLDGIGIATLPLATIQTELSAGTLHVLPVRQVFPSLAFTASYRRSPFGELAKKVAEMAREEAMIFADKIGPEFATPP